MKKVILSFLLFLTACRSSDLTKFHGVAMTIPYEIKIGGKLTSGRKKEVEATIRSTFTEIDQIYNNWNPQSEISKLNSSLAQAKTPISFKLNRLLEVAQKVNHLSQGLFDPTVGPLSSYWKKSLKLGQVPQEDLELRASVGFDNIHIEDGFFWKERDKTSLDLGGIAKGYAVDLIAQRLAEKGFKNIFVEWGGEIRTIGPHPSGRKWKIAITGVGIVEFQDASMATSGNYIQQWKVDGIKYTHIINPKTKRPLLVSDQSISSATVLAPTCAEADAIATALMLFETTEEAMQWISTLENVQCWLAKGGV